MNLLTIATGLIKKAEGGNALLDSIGDEIQRLKDISRDTIVDGKVISGAQLSEADRAGLDKLVDKYLFQARDRVANKINKLTEEAEKLGPKMSFHKFKRADTLMNELQKRRDKILETVYDMKGTPFSRSYNSASDYLIHDLGINAKYNYNALNAALSKVKDADFELLLKKIKHPDFLVDRIQKDMKKAKSVKGALKYLPNLGMAKIRSMWLKTPKAVRIGAKYGVGLGAVGGLGALLTKLIKGKDDK